MSELLIKCDVLHDWCPVYFGKGECAIANFGRPCTHAVDWTEKKAFRDAKPGQTVVLHTEGVDTVSHLFGNRGWQVKRGATSKIKIKK